ncbi:DUF859 family phage minor structural protein [uncultured Granulicatella sp.]|uniref:DUF859 family phage minor structural protein n=1 Tax=uncultured Granulicatella sp. TaxID=316089 RepID=UPI0028DD1461|nr:DUF859 family phage minor structural protein [uncultured Granulicatella sp.]
MARIEKYTSSGYAKLALEVNETSYSIENNDSPTKWELWLERGSTWVYDLNNESLAEAEINDQKVISKYVSFDLRNTNRVLLGSGTLTIPHNEDGTKSITIRARLTNVADQGDIDWFYGTVTLTNIPRASSINSINVTELEQPITLNINKKVDGFKHRVWWQINDSGWVDLGNGHDTNVQFTVPIDYANRITNSENGSLDVCVRTYQGNNQIGEDVYKRGLNIKVPSSIVPTLNAISIVERTAKIAESIPSGNYIKDKSIMRVTAEGAVGAYGSKIVSTEITVDDLVVRSHTGDFPANKAGTLNVTAKVTDSRGRITTKATTVKVLDYYSPRIIAFLANRTGNGTNKTIMANVIANVSPLVIDGINKNPYTLKIQYSEKKANRWLDAITFKNESTEKINRQIDCGAFYDLAKAYNIRIMIQDKLSDIVDSVLLVRSSRVLMAWGDNRLAIGGFPELKDHFESFLPVAFHSSLNVENGIMSRGNPIQEFMLTTKDGKSQRYNGDLNTLKTAGGYHAYGVKNNPNGTNNYGYINVTTHSSDNGYCIQMYSPFNSTVIHVRKCESGAWSQWTNVWKDVQLLNGWKSYYESHHTLQYKVRNDGSIELRGSINGGNNANGQPVFKMPVEFRTTKQSYMICITGNYTTCTLIVYNNGTVVCGNGVNNGWLCLDGVIIANN